MSARPLTAIVCLLAGYSVAVAQQRRPASPSGSAATQIGGYYDERAGYVGGKWIEILHGRPIKRGRDLFGPPDFIPFLNDGAPVWRAGANYSTRLITELPLMIEGTRIDPGEYTVFIQLGWDEWTLIISEWPAQTSYDYHNRDALFGAFYYTKDKDVVRATMKLESVPYSFEQLSWQFLDMSTSGGRMAILWDKRMASVPFTVVE